MPKIKMPSTYQLTPAQLAKQAERKAAKLARAAAGGEAANGALSAQETERRRIIKREWIPTGASAAGKLTARVVTWNVSNLPCESYGADMVLQMLAQTLVRESPHR